MRWWSLGSGTGAIVNCDGRDERNRGEVWCDGEDMSEVDGFVWLTGRGVGRGKGLGVMVW